MAQGRSCPPSGARKLWGPEGDDRLVVRAVLRRSVETPSIGGKATPRLMTSIVGEPHRFKNICGPSLAPPWDHRTGGPLKIFETTLSPDD